MDHRNHEQSAKAVSGPQRRGGSRKSPASGNARARASMRRNTARTDERLDPRVSEASEDCLQAFAVASATLESLATSLTLAEECERQDLVCRGIEASGLRGTAEARNKAEPR